ncbi:histone deacetylase family protein [Shimia marina]|uniref:Histone deacetylase-like amidohydrolase n=1 Tax=Shimia marina TaxID=321267 RepID=A0A0N7LRN4_9RHOB|nr:histone deacetylase family protein [Shimia marina]CUH51308.1 Histone deacetylase-like amidohydrolase [Shimia marina]SFD52469.1 Acetoin utilization deacetylase AcuC [Shimia marina]
MPTALFSHESSLTHVTPPGHPEQVARIAHIQEALSQPDFQTLERRSAPECSDADILLCHPQSHLEAITRAEPTSGSVALDADTHMSPGSVKAARHAVGGCLAAVDAVMAGEVGNAFVACRPPGHHAEQSTPMGFCLFGTAAIAARHAMERHGLSRVAVVDFDVHHGNGTQALLWDEPRSLFIGSHQNPLWPGTGMAEETGGHNNVMNLPLPPHSDGRLMRATYEAEVFPALRRFAPELVILSAGFDAHRDDPLAQLEWTEADFVWLTEQLCDLAAAHCGGRVVSTLEGGYDLNALAASVAAHVRVLMERAG